MSNELENTAPCAIAPYPIEPPVREKVVFSRKDWIFLAIAFPLAVYPALAFSLRAIFDHGIPGIGSALFFLAMIFAGVAAIGRRGRWVEGNILLLGAAALCALTLGVYSHQPMRLINHFVTYVLTAIGLLSASGMNRRPLGHAAMLGESFVHTFSASFSHMFKPFSAFVGTIGSKKRAVLGVFAGVLIGIPVLMLVVDLLSAADTYFSEFLFTIVDGLENVRIGRTIWDGVRIVFFALLFFSIFYALQHPKTSTDRETKTCNIPASAAVTVLVMLDLVYFVFFGVQIEALFGAAREAAAAGGYAQYAREGFFQLVTVAAINLAAVMCAGVLCPRKKAVQICSVILCVLTAVLLASAVWRMCLYISVYGLSFLRILTFYAMAVIAVATGLCIYKCIRPEFKVFPILLSFAVSVWVLFSICDTGRIIAKYNIDAYLDGQFEEIDVYYMTSLSSSVVPQLRRLDAQADDPIVREKARSAIEVFESHDYTFWTWSIDRMAVKE